MNTGTRHRGVLIVIFFFFVAAAAMTMSGKLVNISPLYGSEWASLSPGAEEKNLRAVAIDPLNTRKILIGSGRGVFLSVDGGKAWTNVLDLSTERKNIPADLTAAEKTLIDGVKMPDEVDMISGCTAIAIDPAFSQKILAGSVEGLYTSDDGGKNWVKADGALQAAAPCVLSVAVDPSNPDMVYAGTFTHGLFTSLDGGKTWSSVEVSPDSKSVSAVAVNPIDSNVIFAGTTEALYRTKDAGATWTKVTGDVRVVECLTIGENDHKTVYAGTSSGLYKSSDEGDTWTGVGNEVFGGKKVKAVAVSPSDSNAVYAATAGAVYGSPDKGASWQDLSQGAEMKDAMALAFDPLDSAVIWAATADGLYKTAVAKGGTAVAAAVPAAPEPEPAGVAMADEAQAEEVIPEMTLPSEEEVETLDLGGGSDDPFSESASTGEGAEEKEPEGPPIPTIDDVRTILGQFGHEPTVQEIQEVAMRFAEVHPDLIEGWRKGAKWRALLPDFTIEFEKETLTESHTQNEFEERRTRATEIEESVTDEVDISPSTGTVINNETEFNFTSDYENRITTSYEYENDRERQENITFEFEWELGDFLYNPDQVRISDEARDLVELRNDVLEEVTQFYFQRRQLQIDLLLSPPEDLRERLRMELQMQEVTANIDYLTGGYLTQRLNDVKKGITRKSGMLRRLFNI